MAKKLESYILKRRHLTHFFLFLTALVLVSGLRAGLILVYPLFTWVFLYLLGFRISRRMAVLVFVSILTIPLGFILNHQPFTFNTVLSIYIISPVLILILASVKKNQKAIADRYLTRRFMRYLAILMIANNFIGVAQYIILRNDDAFSGFYSTHGIGAHGLGIINGIMFLYFFIRFMNKPKGNTFFITLFFLSSFILSFFGLALVLLICALILYYLFFQFRIITVLKIIPLLVVTLGILHISSSRTFEYNVNILNSTVETLNEQDFSPEGDMPRKLTMFHYYSKVFPNDAKLFLFGCGPGTFNSRTSFLLNGDYSENLLVKWLGESRPQYAEQYAYPLWNKDLLSIEFNDGTRNQPFSSLIAFLAEYGFIFTITLLLLVVGKLRSLVIALKRTAELEKHSKFSQHCSSNRDFLIVSSIFMALIFISGNLVENTEILVFVIVMKLMELSILNRTVQPN